MTNTAQNVVFPDSSSFPTFLDLRSTHNQLLRKEQDTNDVAMLRDEVRIFIARARATGAILDEESHRDTAQALIDYWITALYRAHVDFPSATLVQFDESRAPKLPDSLCPYVGLEAFGEGKAEFFFGRRRLVQTILEKLEQQTFVAVLGQSGAGKSSVVMGGLLPALRRGELAGSDAWKISPPIVPGSDPLAALARLFTTMSVDHEIGEFLRDPSHLGSLLDREDRPVLLVVDQFEELFTLCDENVAARNAFAANVIALVERPDNPHRIVVTMRSDFEMYVARIPALQSLFERGEVRITPLNAAELREAIERPASLVGLKFDEGLVEALVNDTLGEPAALPLLQFTLLKLWDKRRRNRVTNDEYKALGGGRQALKTTADKFFSSLLHEDQLIVKRILLRIVRYAAGSELMRNRVKKSEIFHAGEDPKKIERVLALLIKERLVRHSPGETEADDQVEVAHESLIRNWPTLVGWLQQFQTSLERLRFYEKLAIEWQASNRVSGFLDAGQIAEAERWLKSTEAEEVGINPLVLELVQASRKRLDTQAAEERKRKRQRNWAVAALIAAAFVFLASMARMAWSESARQRAQSDFSDFRRMEAEKDAEHQRVEAAYQRGTRLEIETKNRQITQQVQELTQQKREIDEALTQMQQQKDRAESLSREQKILLREKDAALRSADSAIEQQNQMMQELAVVLEEKETALKEKNTALDNLALAMESVKAAVEAAKETLKAKRYAAAEPGANKSDKELTDALDRALAAMTKVRTVERADAVVRAKPEELGLHQQSRPLRPGVSIGFGTLGCFVQDREGQRYALSLAFVLGEKGTPVFQPGIVDDRAEENQVGVVAFVGPDDIRSVAIAKLSPGIAIDLEVPQVGRLTGVAANPPNVGDVVRIVGRGSGLVEGKVLGIDFENDIVVNFEAQFPDSGAPVINAEGEIIGLVWSAGFGNSTYVIPIRTLLEEADVELVRELPAPGP